MYTYPTFAAKLKNRFCMQIYYLKKQPFQSFLLLLLLIPAISFAQNKTTIAGIVLDEKSQPMPGATVTAESGQFRKSVQTDNNGRFRFDNLEAGAVFRFTFSFVGFAQKVMDDVRADNISDAGLSVI